MYVTPRLQCGRKPVIHECVPTKAGIRRRLVYCPNYCSIFQAWKPSPSMFIFLGEGDDNTIYKEYNRQIAKKEREIK